MTDLKPTSAARLQSSFLNGRIIFPLLPRPVGILIILVCAEISMCLWGYQDGLPH